MSPQQDFINKYIIFISKEFTKTIIWLSINLMYENNNIVTLTVVKTFSNYPPSPSNRITKSTAIFNFSISSLLVVVFSEIISCKMSTQCSDTNACFIPSKKLINNIVCPVLMISCCEKSDISHNTQC